MTIQRLSVLYRVTKSQKLQAQQNINVHNQVMPNLYSFSNYFRSQINKILFPSKFLLSFGMCIHKSSAKEWKSNLLFK